MLITLVIVFSVFVAFQDPHTLALECSPSQESFELISGFTFKAPNNVIRIVPETFHLTECIAFCRHNATCRAVSFEASLCVLFSSSAQERPDLLEPSQLPALIMFAQKICFEELTCEREWVFDRVSNYKLLQPSKRIVSNVSSSEKCMEICLKEKEFECRSASYLRQSNECQMSDVDRYSVKNNFEKYFVPAEVGTEYLENNCVETHKRLCTFSTIRGKSLQIVDAVFQDVKTLEGCREKCLNVDFRCQAFDLGADPQNSVCRLSHLSSPSFFHTKNRYLPVLGSAVYEVSSCYDISIHCHFHEMVAFIRASEVFNGKVYVKSRQNTCATDVHSSLEFQIRMAYDDLNCDVQQQEKGKFETEIYIQHHDLIVTSQDLGVKLQCQYVLNSQSVFYGVELGVKNNKIDPSQKYGTSVATPNVSMTVTDKLGRNLFAVKLGEPILLKFQITDQDSPYDIFIREVVATDGKDTNQMILIDDFGCKTDSLNVGPITKETDNGTVLKIHFSAFKFPTSDVVQFKALISPCLAACKPMECDLQKPNGLRQLTESFGKRQRRYSIDRNKREETEEEGEIVITHSIHIEDRVVFDLENRMSKDCGEEFLETIRRSTSILAGVLTTILVAQLVTIFAWTFRG